MNIRGLRACVIAVLIGLGLVWLLFLPALAQGGSAPAPGAKGSTEASAPKRWRPSGPQRSSLPAGVLATDFSQSSYTTRGTHPAETITYTLLVSNNGNVGSSATEVKTSVPASTTYVPNSAQAQGGGSLAVHNGLITWTGGVPEGQVVTVTYRVVLPNQIGAVVTATASIYDPSAAAVTIVNDRLQIEAPAGGPDLLGYSYKDSLGGGIGYSWVPTTTATKLDFGPLPADDVVTGPVDIGFTFRFYTNTYTQTYINTNGMVMFGLNNASNTNNLPQPIPSPTGSGNFASCLFADLALLDSSQGVWVETRGVAGAHTTIITFRAAYSNTQGAATELFQMILYETSNKIKCQYAQTPGPIQGSGAQSAIGTVNIDGSVGLQYFYGDPAATDINGPLEPGLAIEFTPGAAALPLYLTSAVAASYNVHPGDVATYTLMVHNTGNADGTSTAVDNPIPPGTQVVPGSAHVQGGGNLTASGASIHWSGTVTAGQGVTITFGLTVPTTLNTVFTDTAAISDTQAGLPVVMGNPYELRVLPPPTGGPDAFGYTYRDSFASGTPITFSWVPTTTATHLDFGPVPVNSVVTGPVPIGFTFGFYGGTYTQAFISTNGLVSFGSGSASADNAPIPTAGNGVYNYAACLWDNLIINDASQGVWVETLGSASNHYTVITFRTDYNRPVGVSSPGTFQMILYEKTGAIKCQYLDMPGPVDASGGAGATIGLENADGTSGIQYFYKAQDPVLVVGPLEPRLAILFSPGPPVPVLAASSKTVAALMHPGERVTYTIQLANDGPVSGAATTLSDSMPLGAAYVPGSAQVLGGGALTANGSGVQWTGPVASGQQVTVTFAVTLPLSTMITNTATISNPQALVPVTRQAVTPIQPNNAPGVGWPTYGYADSYSPGVSDSWVMTTGASHVITTPDVGTTDDGWSQIPLGFAFTFFGRPTSSVAVGTNGVVGFSGAGITGTTMAQPIPTPGLIDNFASCFWAHQAIINQSTEGIWYDTQGVAPHRRAVITFVLEDFTYTTVSPYQYQMILREDDGSILCQYKDMSGARDPSGAIVGDGRFATIGVEGPHGDAGVQYFSGRSQAPFIGPIENNLAILFSPSKRLLFLPLVSR